MRRAAKAPGPEVICLVSALRVALLAACAAFASLVALPRAVAQPQAKQLLLQGDGLVGSPHTATAAGLSLTLDTRWVRGSGYRPVRITLTPTTPIAADRRLTVYLDVDSWWLQGQAYCRVGTQIELPAGSGPVSATLSVPQINVLVQYRLTVIENGRVVPGLSVGVAGAWVSEAGWTTWEQRPVPRVLAIGEKPIALDILGRVFFDVDQFRAIQNSATGASIENVVEEPLPYRHAMWSHPDALPTRWINYSSVDLICISWPELERLAERRPEAWSALRDWTAAGGNLIVYHLDEQGADWAALEDRLRLPHSAVPSNADTVSALKAVGGHADWWEPEAEDFGLSDEVKQMLSQNATFFTEDGSSVSAQDIYSEVFPPEPDKPTGPLFLARRCMMGMVVASSSDDLFEEDPYYWGWILNTIGQDRWLWTRRHGLTLVGTNPDFFDFLIPGVGMVPATVFRVLISLFVLVIGPLNYFLLYRWKRLHLLIVTVPAFALVVTAGLFVYALLADGLSTRVRARSITLLDQPSGRAVTWARLSYYAGLAPRRGLAFSEDTAVLPLDYQPHASGGVASHRREIYWRRESPRQWLAEGWLRARVPMQLLTVRTSQMEYGLDVDSADGPANSLVVRNGLGARLAILVLRGSDGNYYATEHLAPDESVRLEPARHVEALGRMRELVVASRPEVPVGFDSQSLRAMGRRWGIAGVTGQTTADATTSRLEESIRPLGVPESKDVATVEPGEYIAVLEHWPGVELGIDSAGEEASIHVIRGRW